VRLTILDQKPSWFCKHLPVAQQWRPRRAASGYRPGVIREQRKWMQ
jgi:hypothetical protein